MKFETLAIHAGRGPDSATGAVREPLHLSTTFERGADGTYPHGYDYTRSGNPNRTSLERAITALERGKDAIAFASGSAATLAVFALTAPGGRIVCASDCYYGTGKQLRDIVPRWGVDVEFVDVTNLTEVSQALAVPTSLLWFETPSNPLLRVADIAALVDLAHDRGTLVGVDNTFASPVLQQPLALGADVVMHSTTKYLGGHSDVLGGIVVTRDAGAECAALRQYQATAGGVPSPFDCWLLLRSLPTLPLRVRAQAANALAVARFLHADKRVEKVHYAGLPDHPGHEIALRQMSGWLRRRAVDRGAGRARPCACGGRENAAVHPGDESWRGREPHRTSAVDRGPAQPDAAGAVATVDRARARRRPDRGSRSGAGRLIASRLVAM